MVATKNSYAMDGLFTVMTVDELYEVNGGNANSQRNQRVDDGAGTKTEKENNDSKSKEVSKTEEKKNPFDEIEVGISAEMTKSSIKFELTGRFKFKD